MSRSEPFPFLPVNLSALRADLKQGRTRLAATYQGRPGAYLRAHSDLLDAVLIRLWQAAAPPRETALVAVGGFGRREQFPHSDVDLLILLHEEPGARLTAALERLVGGFWDVGLEVGHSVRTIASCLEEARRDVTVATNLLEARRITGSRRLFSNLRQAFREALDVPGFVSSKVLEQQQRHTRFQDSAYNLEPNVKESPGGLRDLQNCLWIARALGMGGGWHGLARAGLLSRSEVRRIMSLQTRLQDLRIRLHRLAGRREDRLLFDYQETLASELACQPRGGRAASDVFMQRYYRTAKEVRLFNHALLIGLSERLEPRLGEPALINAHFSHRRGLLEINAPDVFERHPAAILDAFLLLQQRTDLVDLSPATVRALVRAVPRIDAAFRRVPENRARFLAMLRAPRGLTHALRRMNLYGVLGRYLPVFGRVVGQMQHDLFHVYTVDEHILMVVRNLRRFTLPEYAHEYPLCSRLIANFERQEVLYIAALFHDIAKGRGGDHSILGAREARRFCRDHGLSEEDTELVVWLVAEHLTMSTTAQKQDLSDPAVIAAFAARVKTQRRLTALYLLTVADIRGTSPKVWNAWKGKLLEELFRATERNLSGGMVSRDVQMELRRREALRLLARAAVPPEVPQEVWPQLGENYFLRHGAQEIAWHTRMLARALYSATPLVRARAAPHGEGIQVMIYTPDREDLFARICAFFERMNFNVVEARIHTTPHGYALDTFLILDLGGISASYRDLLPFIEFELAARLASSAPPEPPLAGRVSRLVRHFPIEPRVSIAPDERGQYHVLSVTAGDRPGLLSRIAQVLFHHGIRLHMAKITTLGERAEDTFLVRADDERLDHPRQVVQLQADLIAALRG
ncbi:[protein-PII] uridylyltransferase [Thiobacter aerophilum]|uniref:Bifunctional uridylyltransferase/uridylyl-removing enzyme n=1 Tax=Thiobacter aerophilum TaxID=3121275 RepID=A0ABV0EEC9_9BURK